MSGNWEKLIVALDLEKKSDIERVIAALAPNRVKFKVGSVAFIKFGPEFVKELVGRNLDVFLDLKLYDIPNTMARASAVITELGCWAFTVHLYSGDQALAAVKATVSDTAKSLNKPEPLILGVSILTSFQATSAEVNSLVKKADSIGLGGVVSSANDAGQIKKAFPGLKVVTPGIRNLGDARGDQERIATASTAFANGADYIVVGRPIIGRKDCLQAAEDILQG